MNFPFSPSEIAISSAAVIVGLSFLVFFVAPLLRIYTHPLERISALILACYMLVAASILGVTVVGAGVWWFSHA